MRRLELAVPELVSLRLHIEFRAAFQKNEPFNPSVDNLMKNIFTLLVVVAALSACSKTATPEAAPATPPVAAAPVATPAPAAATAAASDLPKECQEYLDKVNACVSKQSGAAGDAIKAGMEQTKAAWGMMGTDKTALAAACKAVSDGFAAQASMLKC